MDLTTWLRGIKYSVCGVYSPERRAEVYCLRRNLKYRNWLIIYVARSRLFGCFIYGVYSKCSVIIDLSLLVLFRADETNLINRLRIPTGRRYTSWLCTSATEELNQGFLEKKSRLWSELGIFRIKSGALTTRATLPPFASNFRHGDKQPKRKSVVAG